MSIAKDASSAVQELLYEKPGEAVCYLSNALSTLRCIQTDSSSPSDLLSHPKTTDHGLIFPVELPSLEEYPSNISPNSAFVVYNRAFVLADVSNETWKNTDFMHYAACIIIYDTALTYHREAVRRDSNASLLKKAAKQYACCYELLNMLTENNHDSAVVCYLLPAVANNMGHIQAHLFNFSEIEAHRSFLDASVQYMLASKYQVAEEIVSFFHVELLFNKCALLSHAPAA